MARDTKIQLPRMGLQNTYIARAAFRFCETHCDQETRIHHPECLSTLWNSLGELVAVAGRPAPSAI